MFWSYLGWVISSIIILPGGLFSLPNSSAKYLRKFLRWLLTARALFAVRDPRAARGITPGPNSARKQHHRARHARGHRAVPGRQQTTPGPTRTLNPRNSCFRRGFFSYIFCSSCTANLVALKDLGLATTWSLLVSSFSRVSRIRVRVPTFANEERLLAIDKELEIARRIQSSTLPHSVRRSRDSKLLRAMCP